MRKASAVAASRPSSSGCKGSLNLREERAVDAEAAQEDDEEADAAEGRFGGAAPAHQFAVLADAQRAREAHEQRLISRLKTGAREEQAAVDEEELGGAVHLRVQALRGEAVSRAVLLADHRVGDAPVDRQVGIVPEDGALRAAGDSRPSTCS